MVSEPSSMDLLGIIQWIIIQLLVASLIFLILDYLFGKLINAFSRVTRREDIAGTRFIIRIALAATVFSTLAYLNGQQAAAMVTLALLALVLILGTRAIIEEYFTGRFLQLVQDYKFGIGDHVEVNGYRGYVLKQTSLGIIIKGPRNELVYVPNTFIVKHVVKRISTREGFEIRIPFKIPRNVDVGFIREELGKFMENEGVVEPSIDVVSLDVDHVELVARGMYRDLRTLDEMKYRVLDKVLELVDSFTARNVARSSRENPVRP